MLKKLVVTVSIFALAAGIINPAPSMAATSGKNITWTKVTQESQSNNFNDVIYNKDKIYVVVGDDGSVVRSEDAKEWKTIPLQTTANLNAIATNSRQFVAVGNDGIIIQSADGKSWAKGSIRFSKAYTFEQITGKARKFYGDMYEINWTTKAKPSQLQFKDIIWDGKKYVAIADWEVHTGSLKKGKKSDFPTRLLNSHFIVTSKDGKKWTAKYADVPDLEKIVYTGNKYTAISKESISSSADLTKWKTITPGFRGELADIIYNNGKYMTIGWDGYLSARTGTIYTSADGVNWKAVINKKVIGSGVSENTDKYGKPNGFSDLGMNCLLWDGRQYVIGGLNGMILTSKSGTSWEKLNETWDVNFIPFVTTDWSGARTSILKIIYDGQQYIEVGNNGTILVSKDLITGIIARTRPSVDYRNITYDGGSRYLTHGENDTIWESANGYNWKQVELPDLNVNETINWQNIAAYQGTAVAICQTRGYWYGVNDSFYYYSDKPGSWTKMNFPTKFAYIYDFKYIKDKYYLFTESGIITSKDGKKWSILTGTKKTYEGITYNGKIFIGKTVYSDGDGKRNVLYTSSDCKKWTRAEIKKDGKKYYLTAASVVWNGKQFVTIGGKLHKLGDYGSDSENVTAFSSDGKTWTLKNGKTNDYEYGTYGNKTYLAIDSKGDIYNSTNAIDYTKTNKGTSQPLITVIWDGKKFLAGGERGVILASTKGKDAVIPPQDKWIDDHAAYNLSY